MFWILTRLVKTILVVIRRLSANVVFWPWYVFCKMTQLLKTLILIPMMRLAIIVLIWPCYVVYQVCMFWPLYWIQKIVLATYRYSAMSARLLIQLAKVVGPVVGIVSLVHISLECSEHESFKVVLSRCGPDASCLLLVHSRFNCSAIWS